MNAENSGMAARAKPESPAIEGILGIWTSTLRGVRPGANRSPRRSPAAFDQVGESGPLLLCGFLS